MGNRYLSMATLTVVDTNALALWGWPQAQIGPHQSSGLSRGCSTADMCDSALKLDILLRNCSSRYQRLAPVYAHIDSDRQDTVTVAVGNQNLTSRCIRGCCIAAS